VRVKFFNERSFTMASKNLFGKSRKPGNAYAVVYGANGWKYEILKLYKSVESSKKDPYARAFCFVHGFADEYGDTYLRDIPGAYPALEAAEKKLAEAA
jgi:hypothetical protein